MAKIRKTPLARVMVDAEEADGGLDRLAEMANAAPVARKDAPCFATPDPGRWSDETLAALDRDWHAGLPTAEIGQRLGFTKNAIVGKAHRRHLPGRLDPIVRNAAPKPPKPVRPAWPPTPLNPQPAGFVTLPPLASVEQSGWPSPQGISASPSAPPLASVAPAPLASPLPRPAPPAPTRTLPRPVVAWPKAIAAQPVVRPHVAIRPVPVAEPLDWRAEGWPEPGSPETLGGVVAAQGIAEHPLAGRDARCCQWPIGEPGRPGFRYCDAPQTTVRRLGPLGVPVFVPSPYCEAHRAASVTRYVSPGRAAAGSAEGERATP